MKLNVGDKAPHFTAPDHEGITRTLDHYEGSWLLLYFYPRDNTPGCIAQACSLRDNYDALKSLMNVVGVSAESTVTHAKFVQKHRLPFTLLADPDKRIISDYGTGGLLFNKRTSFLIDPDGTIVKIYEKVRTRKHAEELIDDFKNIVDSIWRAS